MTKSVVIYGGGQAGVKLAKELEEVTSVTLFSPLDYYEVPMALPSNLVEPAFDQRALVPLTEALPKAQLIQGQLSGFEEGTGTVQLPNGEAMQVTADVSVLATGSRYATELTRAQSGNRDSRMAQFKDTAAALQQAQRILIVGGGAIGVELAGEILQDMPGKDITLVESSAGLLPGTSRKVAATARDHLQKSGVTLRFNDRVIEPAFGETPAGGVAKTAAGEELPFDLIFWAVGGRPNTSFLPPEALTGEGRIPVDDFLRMQGRDDTYVLGDIAALEEAKKAIYVNSHIKVASKNIRATLKGETPKARYKAQTGNDIMLVTLGRNGGVAHLPGIGRITTGWLIRIFKARDMLVGMTRKALKLAA